MVAQDTFADIKPIHIDINQNQTRGLSPGTNDYILSKLNAIIDNDNYRILVGNKSYSPQPVSDALSTEVKEWATRVCEPKFVPSEMPLSTWETVMKEMMKFKEKMKNSWEMVIMHVKNWFDNWTDIHQHPETNRETSESLYTVTPTPVASKNLVENELPTLEPTTMKPTAEIPNSTSPTAPTTTPSLPTIPVTPHTWIQILHSNSTKFDKFILFPLFLTRITILLTLLISSQVPPNARPWPLPPFSPSSPLSPAHVAAAEAVFAINDALRNNLAADIFVLSVRTFGAGEMAWSRDAGSWAWCAGMVVWVGMYVGGEALSVRWIVRRAPGVAREFWGLLRGGGSRVEVDTVD